MTNTNRRNFLKRAAGATAAATLGAGLFSRFAQAAEAKAIRFAFCNEVFLDLKWSQEKIFNYLVECGYQGVEIAPFTINTDITKVSAAERRALRQAAERSGIEVCGLHWILSKTEGLHLTTPDKEVRRRTARYLGELGRFCGELGGKVMVFGSPLQRNRPDGMSMVEGYRNAAEVLSAAVPELEKAGVVVAMEPLASWETNFLFTAEDARRLERMVGSPSVTFMIDCKAMWAMEPQTITQTILRQKGRFVHFHANDPNLLGPGFGELDFVPIFKALKEANYDGWVSVEPIQYTPGAERLAKESLAYMKSCLSKAG